MLNSMKFIDNRTIEKYFNIESIVDICNYVFTNLNTGDVYSPAKYSMTLPGNSSKTMCWINSMPSYLLRQQVAGVKWVTVNSDNKRFDLPTTEGVIVLNNLETGLPFAIVDAGLITYYRTAASVLLAAQKYAPSKVNTLTIAGPGKVGCYVALFLLHYFPIKKINVISKSFHSFMKFKKFIQKNYITKIYIKDTNSIKCAVNESDIIITSSTAMYPILRKEHFSVTSCQHQFISGLTAFNDISTDILEVMDAVIFDDYLNAKKRMSQVSGVDFSAYKYNNTFGMAPEHCCSKPIVAGKYLYLPVGISAMDLAIANYLFQMSMQSQLKVI